MRGRCGVGSKAKRNKTVSLDKCFKNISMKLQKQYAEGLLKLSILVDNTEINILEELSAAVLVLDHKYQYRVLMRCIGSLDSVTIEAMLDEKYAYEYEKYTILNSVSSVDKPFIKFAVLKALQSKNMACGEIITTIVYDIMETFNGHGNVTLDYGVDSCILATVLYWAYENKIVDDFFKYIPSKYFKDVKQLEYIGESYRETLTNTNITFGQMYYDFKTNTIDRQEYLKLLVSENGALPIPKGADLTNSPEFSWQVVEDIVGKKMLKDMDYSDEIKEAISHIFQRYYDSIHAFNAGVYSYLIQGFYYSIHKEKIKNSIRQGEEDRNHVGRCETKIRELKSNVKVLKKEVDRQKRESDELKRSNDTTQRKLIKLEGEGLTDIDPYKEKIRQKEFEIEELRKRLEELERSSAKRDNTIVELEGINKNLKETVEYVEASNGELKERVDNLVANYNDDSIPIECIVNSIKDYRVIIFGGDMLHSVLKNMGFKNLKLIKANNKAVTTNEVKYADAMVIVTEYLSHATCSVPRNTAESCGTPIMYFNNKSANKLCRDLFSFLNSEGYKKRVG